MNVIGVCIAICMCWMVFWAMTPSKSNLLQLIESDEEEPRTRSYKVEVTDFFVFPFLLLLTTKKKIILKKHQ